MWIFQNDLARCGCPGEFVRQRQRWYPPTNPMPGHFLDGLTNTRPASVTESDLEMQRLKVRELELQLEILKAEKQEK